MLQQQTQFNSLATLIDRLRGGDEAARPQLIEHACERLRVMVRRQLRAFPAVQRWEETSDVLQGVLLRLCRALEKVQPRDVREFFALSSTMIRRELLDLKRHYYGPEGMGAHHATRLPPAPDQTSAPLADQAAVADTALDPARNVQALELHEQIAAMPPELREVVDLIWYQGLTLEETARVLRTSSRTVSRRWREARMVLGKWLCQ